MQNSDWIAIGSLIISLVSAAFTAFYARTQYKLNKVHLADKKREAAGTQGGHVAVGTG